MAHKAVTASQNVRFQLIDSIEQIDETSITAVKNVTQAEEYLQDHFPAFPVLPGVLMLEAAVQAASWLVLHRTGFRTTVAVLGAAKNIRYGHFVAPGRQLRMAATHAGEIAGGSAFKIEGSVVDAGREHTAITGRVELACFNVADRQAGGEVIDDHLRDVYRTRWTELTAGLEASLA